MIAAINWDAVLQSTLSGCLITVFGATVAHFLTKRPRHTQELIADRLDTETPGGLGDIAKPRKPHPKGR